MTTQSEGDLLGARKRSRLVSWIGLAVLIVLATVVIGLIVINSRYQKLRVVADSLPGEIKKAREAGIAVTIEDLNAGVTKNSDQFLETVSAFEKLSREGKLSPNTSVQFKQQVTPQLRSDYAATVKLLEPVLANFERWMAEDNTPVFLNWDVQGEIPESWSSLFSHATQAISYRAFLAFEKGDMNEAERNLLLLDKVSQRLSSWPSMTAFIAATRCMNQIDTTAEGLALHFPNDPTRLSKLRDLLGKIGDKVKPDQAVRLEIFQTVSNLRNLGRAPARGRYYGRPQLPMEDAKVMDRDETPDTWQKQAVLARYLATMTPLWNEMMSDPTSWLSLTKKWDGAKEQAYSNRSELVMVQPFLHSPFDPAVRVLFQRAEHVLTTAMIDAMAYRAKSGAWPKSEEELSRTYLDPFTQQPILAKAMLGVFRVYRVGPNGKDDGGYMTDEARRLSKPCDDVPMTFLPLRKPSPK